MVSDLSPVDSYLPPVLLPFRREIRPWLEECKQNLKGAEGTAFASIGPPKKGRLGVFYLRNKLSRIWSRPTKVFDERNLSNSSRISRF